MVASLFRSCQTNPDNSRWRFGLVCCVLAQLSVAAGTVGAQQGTLEITNARATFGYLGAAHPGGAGRLPGDAIHFTFDIKNLKLDELGRSSYSMLVEVTDAKGHLTFKLGPTNAISQNYLGGNTQPCSAHLEIPLDTAPGDYQLKVTVTDRAANKSVVFERTGKVLAPGFGLVRVATFGDAAAKVPASPIGVVGESIYYSFAPIGFTRDPSTKQPNLAVSLRVLDDKGQPTFAQPLTGAVTKDVPEDVKILPMQFGITLNRVGNFTVELQATDKLSGKSAKVSVPLKVVSH